MAAILSWVSCVHGSSYTLLLFQMAASNLSSSPVASGPIRKVTRVSASDKAHPLPRWWRPLWATLLQEWWRSCKCSDRSFCTFSSDARFFLASTASYGHHHGDCHALPLLHGIRSLKKACENLQPFYLVLLPFLLSNTCTNNVSSFVSSPCCLLFLASTSLMAVTHPAGLRTFYG